MAKTTNNMNVENADLVIGRYISGSYYLGQIDELAVWRGGILRDTAQVKIGSGTY